MSLNSPALFDPVLDRLRFDAAKYYGYPTTHLVVSGYQERPFSHVLRVEVHKDSSSGSVGCLFAKIFKTDVHRPDIVRQRVARDYATTVAVHQAMQAHQGLGVVPPVACYSDLFAMVTEEVRGSTLLGHLTRHAAWWSRPGVHEIDSVLDNVGRWIGVFQSAARSEGLGSRGQMRDYIDHRLKRLVSMDRSGLNESGRAGLLALVDALTEATDGAEWSLVPVHSDMALGNILVADSRIVVLDFAMAKSGTRLQDVSRVFVQLDLLLAKPFIRTALIRGAQKALLRGFDRTLMEDLPMFRLMVLRHRINHLVGLMHDEQSFSQRMYNSRLARRHYEWIRQELNRSSLPAGHTR